MGPDCPDCGQDGSRADTGGRIYDCDNDACRVVQFHARWGY